MCLFCLLSMAKGQVRKGGVPKGVERQHSGNRIIRAHTFANPWKPIRKGEWHCPYLFGVSRGVGAV